VDEAAVGDAEDTGVEAAAAGCAAAAAGARDGAGAEAAAAGGVDGDGVPTEFDFGAHAATSNPTASAAQTFGLTITAPFKMN
jgi:hypothetical protein